MAWIAALPSHQPAGTTSTLFQLRSRPCPNSAPSPHILGTLDDKIELNRRMNQTLESMARAIFQDWFVAFGPVRAKLEGREPYLLPELWDLFPDDLVDSSWGRYPRGGMLKHSRVALT